jgi:hypothetical protein
VTVRRNTGQRNRHREFREFREFKGALFFDSFLISLNSVNSL